VTTPIWGRAGAVIEPGGAGFWWRRGTARSNGSDNWATARSSWSADAGRLLHNWTPATSLRSTTSDGDVGSTSPALLPAYNGFQLAIQGGRTAGFHLLNLAPSGRHSGRRRQAARR